MSPWLRESPYSLPSPLCRQNRGMPLLREGMRAGQALGPHQEPGWCGDRWQGWRQARSGDVGSQHQGSLHRVGTAPERQQRFPPQCMGASMG
jgi:hypothetical protein